MNDDIINVFENAKSDPNLQVNVIRESNRFEDYEDRMFSNRDNYER